MAKFCVVRFERDPLGERVYAQAKMTWGDKIRPMYKDFWHWASDVNYMARQSVARPVIMEIFYNDS